MSESVLMNRLTFVNGTIGVFGHRLGRSLFRKGNRLKFLYQELDFSGNATDLGDVSLYPKMSFLFFLTTPRASLELHFAEIGRHSW